MHYVLTEQTNYLRARVGFSELIFPLFRVGVIEKGPLSICLQASTTRTTIGMKREDLE